MSADIWKIEYHLLPPNERDAIDWFDDKAEAIAAAKARPGHRVQKVVSYLEDREIIWPENDE